MESRGPGCVPKPQAGKGGIRLETLPETGAVGKTRGDGGGARAVKIHTLPPPPSPSARKRPCGYTIRRFIEMLRVGKIVAKHGHDEGLARNTSPTRTADKVFLEQL